MARNLWTAGRQHHFFFITVSAVDGATKKILVRNFFAEYGIFFSGYWKFFNGVHRSALWCRFFTAAYFIDLYIDIVMMVKACITMRHGCYKLALILNHHR